MRNTKLLASLALATSFAIPTVASAILFDPDGNPNTNNSIDLGAFDWGPTSLLAQGTPPLPLPENGGTFEVFTMAKLQSTTDSQSKLNTPDGLGETFEITMIAGLRDKVTYVLGGPPLPVVVAGFEIVPTEVDFFQIFYDVSVDSNQLTGEGFNNGRLILEATTINNAQGSFTFYFPVYDSEGNCTSNCLDILDRASGNNAANDNYNGQLTGIGQGGTTNIVLGGITADPTFFPNVIPATISLTTPNVSETIPFTTVDPADCYDTTASTVGVGNSTGVDQACSGRVGGTNLTFGDSARLGDIVGSGSYLASIGTVNGIDGPDTVFQADYSSTVSGTTIPEPGTLALFGASLAGFGFISRRRRTK
jgi:hypothetical protein